MARVSIVIVSYSRCSYLDRCLASCCRQDYEDMEIVVAVNPSFDGTEDMLVSKYPHVKLVKLHKNLGFFPVLNIAIANASGSYIMTVDDDAYFMQDNAITSLVRYLERDEGIGVVSSNIEGPNENTLESGQIDINVFKTGFAMLRKKVFTDEVGYYPDAFFRSGGENYISKKLWDDGKRVIQVSDVRMYHDQATAGRSDSDWKYYGIRSQVLCTLMRDPLITLPLSVTSKFVKSFVLFVKWRHTVTWVRAWISILIHLPYAIGLRAPIKMKTWKQLRSMEIK